MYGWIYRHLPGPGWFRWIVLLAVAAVVIAALFTWVFPEIAPYMPFNDGTVGSDES